jgi:ribonuclease D
VIASDKDLAEFLPQLRAANWVALDTEADSLHAYPEKLCLVQLSIEGVDRIVDPLSRTDLTALWPALGLHELIIHAADYDLRLLRKAHGFVPDRIFDTMLAARLLGDREFGLVNLVSKYLGITLEKSSQKADWSRRPLTSKMEIYARHDTHYLKPLSDILREKLVEKQRLEWLRECCNRLIAECASHTPPDPDLAWRIKGCHRLNRVGLAVLHELWRWREHEALAACKPPYFILAHEVLIDLADAAAAGRPIPQIIPRHVSPRRCEAIIQAINAGLAVPDELQPAHLRVRSHRQTEAERRRFEEFQKCRDARAMELGIDPTLIASRATLLSLSEDWDTHQADLMPWQRALLA